MKLRWPTRLFAAFLLVGAARAWCGGSGLNVAVVVNQDSTNSVELGNYYAERRQVPPENVLRISWTGGRAMWTYSQFSNSLLSPLLHMLSTRGLTNQVDYVLLSSDIPYRIVQTGSATSAGENSTTAALFYGFKPDYAEPTYNPASCNLPGPTSNSYAGSEGIFRLLPPDSAVTNSFLTMMLTSSNLVQARAIIDHGVASDGSFAAQTVVLGKSIDPARNVRFYSFDDALLNTRLRGGYSMFRTNLNSPYGLHNLLGYQGGHYQFSIQPDTFVPGAIADSLTSYAGRIFEVNDHTTLLAFLDAGASGSYGTVVEPCNYLEKFPSPQVYFYQARGFTLAESYYQSITNPYQGLLVGEPLAAPFAAPPAAYWSNLPPHAVLSGTTNLLLQAVAVDARRPVQQVDIFLDGKLLQTVTNVVPGQDNSLSLNIRGRPISYAVPPGATIQSVAEGLAAAINLPPNTNASKVRAIVHGDRIELRCFDPAYSAAQLALTAQSSSANGTPLTTFIARNDGGFMDTTANGLRSYEVSGTPGLGAFLNLQVTKTNGTAVAAGVTNTSGTMSVFQMVQQLAAAVNAHPALTGADGLSAQDLFDLAPYISSPTADFNLVANSVGWPAARISASLTASTGLTVISNGTLSLQLNLSDLQPRAHVYVTAGSSSLTVPFSFDTTLHPDGFHEISAVVYEGSHVRTQGRVSQSVIFKNTALSAVFTSLLAGSNTALEATLQFAVVANTATVSNIELFTTGGRIGAVAGQQSASFSVSAAYLGPGLHGFYAVVTAGNGTSYRTETQWVRINARQNEFPLSITGSPPVLRWPAVAGRFYEILSSTNLAFPFELDATVVPSNSAGQWLDTNVLTPWRYYRVRSSQ